MKILILQDDFPPYVFGGAGIIAYRLSVEYKRLGHDVEVVSTTINRNDEGVVYVDGIKVNVIYSKYHERWRSYVSLYNPRLINKIKNILINFGPDVVHAHNIHAHLSYASLKFAKKYSKKVIMTAHDIMPFFPGTFTDYIDRNDLTIKAKFNYKVNSFTLFKKFKFRFNPFRNLFIKYYLSKIDKIVAVSNELKEALSQNNINNIDVIYNGINLNEWKVDNEMIVQFRNKYNLVDKKIILFQGRLSGAKGGDIVLGLMNQIKTSNQVKLLVIGKIDSYAERMLNKAKSSGIEDKVVFTGWLDDSEIKIAYSSSDIVLIPSVCFDSFPNGNLEAFASKKPVIATCFGGSREIVVDNENGYIVNPFDIKLLSERVIGLMNDNEKVKRFGESGYELVKQKFSIETSAKQYLNLFFE